VTAIFADITKHPLAADIFALLATLLNSYVYFHYYLI